MKCSAKVHAPKSAMVDVSESELFPVDKIEVKALNFKQAVAMNKDLNEADGLDRISVRIYHCLMAANPDLRIEIETDEAKDGKPVVLTGAEGFTAYLNSDGLLYGELFEAVNEIFPLVTLEEKKTE